MNAMETNTTDDGPADAPAEPTRSADEQGAKRRRFRPDKGGPKGTGSVGDAVPTRRSAVVASASASPAPEAKPLLPRRLIYATTLGVAVIWLLLDQATKVLAVAQLPATGVPGTSVGPLDLRLVRNPGGAFGIPAFPALFLVVTILVVVLVVRALPRTDRLSLAAVYGLVTGGALGNVTDRLLRPPGFPSGHVVDFLDIGWWPVFNVADIGIVVGAVGIAVLLTIVDREERAAAAARATHQSVRPESPDRKP
ncbi:MAG: signal peptidase II [Egibacteraceae bacterium]